MLGYALSPIVGLLLGALVNVLADILPRFRARDVSESGPAEGEQVEASPSDQPTAQPGPQRWPRWIAVEVLLAAITFYLWQRDGMSAVSVAAMVYLALFVLIAVIDIEHRLVLNVVMIPAFALTFIEMIVTGRISLNDALVGYAVAQIVVMAFYLLGGVYLWIVSTRQGKPLGEVPFGFGDVTLATFCGMVLGFPTVLPMLMLMVLLGAAIAILYLVVRALTVRRVEAHMVIPYGPAIVLAAAILLLWQNEVAGMMLGGR